MNSFELRPMLDTDWSGVARVYGEGIATGNATFQTEVPTWESWDQGHLKIGRWVAVSEEVILGWAALTPVSGRCVYAGVAEVSVYVGIQFQGQGIGRALLERLIEDSEHQGFWTLQSGIFPENKSSIALHAKLGFREVGYRKRIGQMHGQWRDTVLMERRSEQVGV